MAEVRALSSKCLNMQLKLYESGWQLGDITMDDNHLITICVELQIVIVNVEYRYNGSPRFISSAHHCV